MTQRRSRTPRAWRGRLRRGAGPASREQPLLSETLPQYEVGRWSYGWPVVHDYGDGPTLRIGAFCSFADITIFLGGEHRVDWTTTYPFSVMWSEAADIPGHPTTKGDVVIGNDVWIASGATILSGATIGDGAVIGTGAVVSGVIEPYAVAAGNPAQMVRKRFDDRTIERLRGVAWWEWPDEEISEALPLLLSPDIGGFLDYAERRGQAT